MTLLIQPNPLLSAQHLHHSYAYAQQVMTMKKCLYAKICYSNNFPVPSIW